MKIHRLMIMTLPCDEAQEGKDTEKQQLFFCFLLTLFLFSFPASLTSLPLFGMSFSVFYSHSLG